MAERDIVLGVDLDEVVFNYLGFVREKLVAAGRQLPDGPPNSWSLPDAGWFKDDADFFKFHGNLVEEGLYDKLELLPGAHETLWDLSNSGYMLNVITSLFVNPGQHQKVCKQTVVALDANGIPYNNLSFLNKKALQFADAYVDDSPKNIESLHEAGRFVIRKEMLYNLSSPGVRATSWEEIREILREKFGK